MNYFRNPSQASLNQAKRNVERHYPVVGLTEEIEKFMELCEVVLPDYFKGVHKYYLEHSKYLSFLSNSS